MRKRVIFVLLDGVRPDAVLACAHPIFKKLMEDGSFCLDGRSIDPPVTLPVHVSMFSGVRPGQHGVSGNQRCPYPVQWPGILERIHDAGHKTAAVVAWEQLCALGRADGIDRLEYINGNMLRHARLELVMDFQKFWTKKAVEIYKEGDTDFLFFHYELSDAVGHAAGWMSKAFIHSVAFAGECVKMLYDTLEPEDHLIVMADHGGHDKDHFDPQLPEDMTVPVFCLGPRFPRGKQYHGWSVMDVAPTLCDLFDIPKLDYYEGESWVGRV